MTKRLFVWLVAAAAAAVAVLLLVMRPMVNRQAAQPDPTSLRNLTVSIDDQSFTLRDGVAERPAAPGSTATTTVRLVGEPVIADVDGDGRSEAALLLSSDPGGSGTFYYAVLAVDDGGSYRATNALALGDRITPQTVEVTDGGVAYRFLERRPGDPMTAGPTVEKTVTVRLDPVSGRIAAVS